MFHTIPQAVTERMKYLETIDAQDRIDGTARRWRMRQIPPETGRFLALLAANSPAGSMIEVGTSAGYSSLWLLLACRLLGRTLTTYELFSGKAELARETFRLAGMEDWVNLVVGDARLHLTQYKQIGLCFVDTEKEIYQECYDAVVPALVPGGLVIFDNAISHQDELRDLVDTALEDRRVDSLVVPIGKGLLLSRKV